MGKRLAAVLAAGLVLGCANLHVHQRPWLEVRTSNFTLWTCLREPAALELARDLELFRSVVEFVVGEALPTSPVPIRVYAFDTDFTYRPFAVPGAAGYFEQSMRENTVVMSGRSASHLSSTRVIQHEYVHFLLENHADFVYPRWYHEGFAEFLGSVYRKGDSVVIGSVPPGRVPGFQGWIPLEDLLGLEPGMRINVASLYAQSWALVHYLNIGRELQEGVRTRSQLTRYFRARERGRSVEDAVLGAFGVSVDELDRELGRYVRKGRYTSYSAEVDTFDLGDEPRLRALASAEVARALGELSLKRERFDQAQGYFYASWQEEPESARTRSGMGAALEGLGRHDEAEREYRSAVEMAPDDAVVHLDLANFLHGRAAAAQDPEDRARLAVAARAEYVKSWKLDDAIPETYARYGETFLLPGQPREKGLKTLRHAHALLPSSTKIRIDLARLYLAMGDRGDARRLALSAGARVHAKEEERAIAEILAATGHGASLGSH